MPQKRDNNTCLVKKDRTIDTIAGRIDKKDEFSIVFPLKKFILILVYVKKIYIYMLFLCNTKTYQNAQNVQKIN